MPNKLQCEQPTETMAERDKRETVTNLIREQVMHALGTPFDLRHVQVRKVWDDHYRVNVIVGEAADALRVANSYFLKVDGDGRLLASTPQITKQY
jgi:hypothetical protein